MLVPSVLALTIVVDIVRMSLAILAGVIGMVGSPLLLAVAANLTVEGIGLEFLAVIVPAPALLTVRLAADALGRAKPRRNKRLAAVRADTTHLDRSG
jgi:hypothetical protein